MFGIMRACSCSRGSDERELRRMHYCGTCKSIGRLYSQKSRVFLNYDAVFLGEILSDLQPNKLQFAPAFVSKSCASMPRADQIPLPLEFAASANIVLAQFKLLDHVADTGSKLVKLAVRTYSQEFELASRALARWEFPYQELQRLMSLQTEREREPSPRMNRLAEPTAGATALVFRHGALTVGANSGVAEEMANLGAAFGEIAYLADAIRDEKQDAEKGQFNALAATSTSSKRARKMLQAKQDEMLAILQSLPIEESRKASYASRLKTNLSPLLFRRQRPPRTVVVRQRRAGCWGSFCARDCCSDCLCCGTEQCCECAGSGCCDCLCAG